MKENESKSTSELLGQLQSGDPSKIVDASRELVSRQDLSAAPDLMDLLRTTNDATVRNAAAMILSDLGHLPVFDVLVDLLKDERTLGYRGTLLHALWPFDCSSIFPTLVDCVIEGNYEVRQEAFILIKGIEVNFENETELFKKMWAASVRRVQKAIVIATGESRPILIALLAFLEQQSK